MKLSLFSVKPAKKLAPIQCFEELVMSDTISYGNIQDEERMQKFLNRDFSFTRSLFSRFKVIKGQVAVSTKIKAILQKRMPDINFVVLDRDTPLISACKIATESNILISDHISTLSYSVLLSKRSTVIDLTSHQYSCNRWIDHSDIDAKVISIHNNTECECKRFTCYPTTEYFENEERNGNKSNSNNNIDIDINEVEELIRGNIQH